MKHTRQGCSRHVGGGGVCEKWCMHVDNTKVQRG